MAQPARSQSLGQSIVALILVAAVVWEVASIIRMNARSDWLTTVVVASAPVEAGTTVDPRRLHRRLRRVDRSRAPLRLAEASGRFFTTVAAGRCAEGCPEFVLMRGDVSQRPEIGRGTQVWKAGLAAPWTVEDFAVGDSVDVAVSAPAPVTTPAVNAADSTATIETPRGAVVPAARAPDKRASQDSRPVDSIRRMKVVGLAAKSGDNPAALFVSMVPGDTAQHDRLQGASLRVVSVVR
jgi:hypothetical protein